MQVVNVLHVLIVLVPNLNKHRLVANLLFKISLNFYEFLNICYLYRCDLHNLCVPCLHAKEPRAMGFSGTAVIVTVNSHGDAGNQTCIHCKGSKHSFTTESSLQSYNQRF